MIKFNIGYYIILILTLSILANSCRDGKSSRHVDDIPVLGVCKPCDCGLPNEFIFDNLIIGMPLSEYPLDPILDSTHLYFDEFTQGFVYIRPIWGYYNKQQSVVGIDFSFSNNNFEISESALDLERKFVSILWKKWSKQCLEENGSYAELTDSWMRCERLVFSRNRHKEEIGVYDACIYPQIIDQINKADSIKIKKTMDLFHQ